MVLYARLRRRVVFALPVRLLEACPPICRHGMFVFLVRGEPRIAWDTEYSVVLFVCIPYLDLCLCMLYLESSSLMDTFNTPDVLVLLSTNYLRKFTTTWCDDTACIVPLLQKQKPSPLTHHEQSTNRPENGILPAAGQAGRKT